MPALTVAFCTYNRADRLEALVHALMGQRCPIEFEILAVNNNSTDGTDALLARLEGTSRVPFRFVNEGVQGIVPARNRAIDEARDSDYLVFLDDDELPEPGLLKAAVDAFDREGAECVGGRVRVQFEPGQRPAWLGDELLGFLAEVDYGDEPFWITDRKTPVWTANVGYRTALFRDGLRFDARYNRAGDEIGGGEDVVMFEALLARGAKIRYRPDMVVRHFVEEWRLCRRYFLKLHGVSGYKAGFWEMGTYPREWFGVPPFLVGQAVRHWARTAAMWCRRDPGVLRQAMNGMHALGLIAGKWRRSRTEARDR